MRVQPLPVMVPKEGTPFQHDLLGRKAFGEALATSLAVVEGPGVFALDGPWGTGKTTFLEMFTQHLRIEGFVVVEINAWETDFAGHPLAALTSSLSKAFPDEKRRKELKQAAIKLLKVVVPPAIRVATSGLLNVNAELEKTAGQVLSDWASDSLHQFEEHAESLAEFRNRLRGLAEENGDKPTVVVVDELDRCRPTYAVELLETIKHVFNEDGLVFVLGVNRRQLDRSAAILYGDTLDPESYFRRFFDVELRLPDPPDAKAVVCAILREEFGLDLEDVPRDLLADFLTAGPYGIRSQKNVLRHYSIVHSALGSFKSDSWWWMLPTFILLRLIDEDTYRAFLAGAMSDEEVVDQVFQRDWTKALREIEAGRLFEAAVISVYKARSGESTLLQKHRSDEAVATDNSHAREVVRWCNDMVREGRLVSQMVSVVADRIDMFELPG